MSAPGVDIGIATTTTSAFVANGASVNASTTVDVNALATKHVTTYAVAIGGGFVGVGGAVSVWSLGTGGASTYDDGQGDSGDGDTATAAARPTPRRTARSVAATAATCRS